MEMTLWSAAAALLTAVVCGGSVVLPLHRVRATTPPTELATARLERCAHSGGRTVYFRAMGRLAKDFYRCDCPREGRVKINDAWPGCRAGSGSIPTPVLVGGGVVVLGLLAVAGILWMKVAKRVKR